MRYAVPQPQGPTKEDTMYGVRFADGGVVAYGSAYQCAQVAACAEGAIVVIKNNDGQWVAS